MDEKQRNMVKTNIKQTKRNVWKFTKNEIREIAYTHGLENKEY